MPAHTKKCIYIRCNFTGGKILIHHIQLFPSTKRLYLLWLASQKLINQNELREWKGEGDKNESAENELQKELGQIKHIVYWGKSIELSGEISPKTFHTTHTYIHHSIYRYHEWNSSSKMCRKKIEGSLNTSKRENKCITAHTVHWNVFIYRHIHLPNRKQFLIKPSEENNNNNKNNNNNDAKKAPRYHVFPPDELEVKWNCLSNVTRWEIKPSSTIIAHEFYK